MPGPRVLLDENLPRTLKASLAPAASEVLTVVECGWGGTKNGELLALAAADFDVFLTMDRGIEYQQNVVALDLCVVRLSAASNTITALLPLVPATCDALARVTPGQVVTVVA
ncbi:DUF5615 family PIN-like protein [Alienimonas chondri]|uniref:DUF5615 domain-containing protein n=1 Tax=Alienimonas chondri TaxID=2681879 RepID=A0ABX1V8A8_9PLAN|nr:DUF5615 family PIN-like protein [Alienimonas chondri]NNJ24399.1 hypothetical protein [Alienimonas chondri]